MAKTKERKTTTPLLGKDVRKVHPKLRMFANGRLGVNTARADFSSCIRTTAKPQTESPIDNLADRLTDETPPMPKKMRTVTSGIEGNVFIERIGDLDDQRDQGARRIVATSADHKRQRRRERAKNAKPDPRRGRLSTRTVRLDEIQKLAEDDAIAFIELGEPLVAPTPVVHDAGRDKPTVKERNFGAAGGKNVLIGIIDVQGFDFAHPDFLDASNVTRFERIWDQGGETHEPPGGFDYGAEITKEDMKAAMEASQQFGLPATDLEPQSQMALASHGTHVASIAAGNRGVCRNAYLAGVLIDLPREDRDRRRSLYDSTRLAHAVDYLLGVAEDLCDKDDDLDELPVSINISLGTNGHAHDASSAVSRWIDSALSLPGRSVCVAAGNAGQEAPQDEDDLGFIMGRIHSSGRIPARGLAADLEWIVVGNGLEDVSENELEIWYSPADRFGVQLRPPGMDWTRIIEPGQFIENHRLDDGTFLSVYNELYHPANGANYIAIYISPFLSETDIKGARAGLWRVRLHGIEVRDGHYHAWIERDDPRRIGRNPDSRLWRFPSFFSEASNVDDSSVSSLACGQRVVSVANHDAARGRINITSSQGPTRDGRFKPDVAADGTEIRAARGFDPDTAWVRMSGTSMASPLVAGVIGLMLGKNPKLTAAQIGGIIQRTSRPLPGGDFDWKNDAGYGVIDPAACIGEARALHRRKELT